MPTRFDFATAGRIIFGAGVVQELKNILPGMGTRPALVTGAGGADPALVIALLREIGPFCEQISVSGEPTLERLQAVLSQARQTDCDCVVAYGGGSVIDTGKALAALLANPGEVLDYLEVVGKSQPLRNPSLPCVAIPTTAGTGSEVTRNAVVAVPEHKVKVSLRSMWMLPRAALVDPELTYSLPPDVTASTGMDALTQVIEPFVSARANAMTDLYCREGIRRGSRSLLTAYADGRNATAREDMAFTSLMGGLALANAGLGAAHGFASPVGGMFDAPHGAVCAALLPGVVSINIRALEQRAPDHPSLERYREIARILTGDERASIQDAPRVLAEMAAALRIPGLRAYGLREDHVPEVVERAADASSMKANPIRLTHDELTEMLERAM